MIEARTIQVIEVKSKRGLGIRGDPLRDVTSWFTLEGVLLAESDPVAVERASPPPCGYVRRLEPEGVTLSPCILQPGHPGPHSSI